MSKIISTNSRQDTAFALLHLFEFQMDRDLDGVVGEASEILYFTDHDVFVEYAGIEYTPLAVTFDSLSEDGSMETDSINISIDNINGLLTAEALASEWRNNPWKITRIVFTPPSEIIDADVYEFGVSDTETDPTNESIYPKLDFANVPNYDAYVLFEGIINTFNATSQVLNGSLTTKFINWNKAYPTRTYNQNEYTSVVSAITTELYWGRQNVT